MKFSILQAKLKQALNAIEKIALKTPSLPILSNVLLEAEENCLKLSATNLETGINFWLRAKVEKQGKIAIPAHVFSSFINFLPPGPINFEEKQGHLHIQCGKANTKINSVNVEDFPIIPQVEKSSKVSIKSFPLYQGLSQIVNIASLSNIKPEISGIFWNFEKKHLTMTATDSFRLGEKKIELEEVDSNLPSSSFILLRQSASLLTSIFGEKDTNLDIYISPNLVMFESLTQDEEYPKVQFVSKLIEGDYPQYQEIIPSSFKTEVIIDKKEFLLQLKRASIFASRINEVNIILEPQKGEISILCQNPELGEYSSSFSGDVNGEKCDISFNYKFLLDGLLNINGEKIFFGISKSKEQEQGPALLRAIKDKTYLYVVMPIQPA